MHASPVQTLMSQGASVDLSDVEGTQSRVTPSAAVNAPLAVSIGRALAAVCAQQRITVYDLKPDEFDDEEGSDEADEDADMQEGAVGRGSSDTGAGMST